MKNVLSHSINDFVKELEKHAKKITAGFDDEEIHHFRTTAKKLRSLLRWQKGNKNFLPSSFLKFYHTGGDLRNFQLLLLSFTEQNINLPRFMLWLSNGIGQCQRDWLKHHPKKAFKELQDTTSSLNLSDLSTKSLQEYYRQKTEKIKEIIALVNAPDDALHEIRKIIKDIYYTRQWCKKHWQPGWNATRKFSMMQLNKLSDLAGSYNDKSVGLQILAVYLKEETDGKAIHAAKAVMAALDQQGMESKKQLVTAIKKFCKRL